MPAHISEVAYTGTSFIEIRVESGADMSGWSVSTYDEPGDFAASYSFGAPTATMAGYDVYVFNAGLDVDESVALVDDIGTVVQFISWEGLSFTASGGPADGATSTDVGSHAGGESLQSDDGGASYYTQSAPNPGTVPCCAACTLIDTPDGPRAVETLRPGDLVMTLDHDPKPIRWTHSGDHPLEEADVDAKPVRIKAGALGRNLPAQDLIVSPQHHILVGGNGQLQQVFASAAFAPAKSLKAVPGIRHMKGKTEITWIRFACDRHEVVTANGCLSESLLLGPMVVNGLTATERQAVTDIFGPAPTPNTALNGPPARECLTVGAVKRQIAKHLKEEGALLAKEIKKWDRDLAMEQYEAEPLLEAALSVQPGETAIRVA